MGNIEDAKVDFQTALKLAEHHSEEVLKANIEQWLQRLGDMTG